MCNHCGAGGSVHWAALDQRDCRGDSSAQGSSWTWILGKEEVNVMICQSAPHHRKRTGEERGPRPLGMTTGWLWLFFHLSVPAKDPKGTDTTREAQALFQLFVKFLSPSCNRIAISRSLLTLWTKKIASYLCHKWVRTPPSAIIHYTPSKHAGWLLWSCEILIHTCSKDQQNRCVLLNEPRLHWASFISNM